MNIILMGSLAALLIITLICLWQVMILRRRFNSALTTKDDQNLEQTLTDYFEQVGSVADHQQKLGDAYRQLASSLSLASQKVSIVRFNPFGDTGGDQSFVLAVLDAHNSGYVLTSIHGRQGTRMYVKPVDYGKSKYTLSTEEKQALDQAAKRIPKNSKDKT